jgi:hypothetical protein
MSTLYNTYASQVFDASDTSWRLHLQGARMIGGVLTTQERGQPEFKFLRSWFDYHMTLQSFSSPDAEDSIRCVKEIILPCSDNESRKVCQLVLYHY